MQVRLLIYNSIHEEMFLLNISHHKADAAVATSAALNASTN